MGIDDTDSREGMCTTFVGLKAILEIMEMGYDIVGYPHLIRLNPNIPWKTRGNGSVVIKFGVGSGRKFVIGEVKGEKIYGFERKSKEGKLSIEEISSKLERYFILDDKNTNPGIVMSDKAFPESLYWRGVREVLSIEEVEKFLREYGAKYKKYKNGRGIIGASAGIAWRRRKKTYELLTYLPEGNKKERWVDEKSVIKMDKKFKSTFDNYDYENDYIAIMPNSKTPVLFGIRGTNPAELISAKDMIRSTDYDSFLIYETNQGSDDHLVRRKIKDIKDYESVILRGFVSENPRRIEGGHVIFKLRDSTGEIHCAAYEPTKGFRDIIEKLHEGDEVEVYGGVRKAPKTVNIEKIRVVKTVDVKIKVSNPICPVCGRKMESIGKGKGYRCRRCGIKLPESAARYKKIERIAEGYYEVPVIARRHLARPLKLMMENIFYR